MSYAEDNACASSLVSGTPSVIRAPMSSRLTLISTLTVGVLRSFVHRAAGVSPAIVICRVICWASASARLPCAPVTPGARL